MNIETKIQGIRDKFTKTKVKSGNKMPSSKKLKTGYRQCGCLEDQDECDCVIIPRQDDIYIQEIAFDRKPKSSSVDEKKSLDETHHNPPQGFRFTPSNLLKFGITFGNVDQDMEYYQDEPNLSRIKQQIEFWHTLKTNYEVNSLKLTVQKKKPYSGLEWDNHPKIGIYKKTATTCGQCIWINLQEAQVLTKLLILVSEQKAYHLREQKVPIPINFKYHDGAISFNPVNFIALGVPRDRLCQLEDIEEKPDHKTVRQKIIQQQGQLYMGGDVSYSLGSVQVLVSAIGDRILIGILKKTGLDAGQRIYFSIHELQYVIGILNELVQLGISLFGTSSA